MQETKRGHHTTEVIVIDSDEEEKDNITKTTLLRRHPPLEISPNPSEVKLFLRQNVLPPDPKPCQSDPPPRCTARKSTSGKRKVREAPPAATPNEVADALQQFLNEVFLSLKSQPVEASRVIEDELAFAFQSMDESQSDETLYPFLLDKTLELSKDSEKVFLLVEEVKERLLSYSSSSRGKREQDPREEHHPPNKKKRITLIPDNEEISQHTLKPHDNEESKDMINGHESKGPNTSIQVEGREEAMKLPLRGDTSSTKSLKAEDSHPLTINLDDEDNNELKSMAAKSQHQPKPKSEDDVSTDDGKNERMPKDEKDIKSRPPLTKQEKSKATHLKKLKAALEECGKMIREKEQAEVDPFAEEDETSYVDLCRYKSRFMSIYNKIIELEDGLPKWKSQVVSLQSIGARQIKKFKTQISRHPEINEGIATFINKGIKKSLNSSFFPDFQDILQIVQGVNKSSKLGMRKEELDEEASQAFQSIGRKLQSRRKFDVHASMESYLEEDDSEPELSDDVKKKLTENQAMAEKSLDRVIQDFTLRQSSRIYGEEGNESGPSGTPKEEKTNNEGDDEEESEDSSGDESLVSDTKTNCDEDIEDELLSSDEEDDDA